MIYPVDFENKIGFDRIRELLGEKCLSPMGLEKIENIKFINDYEYLIQMLSETSEFQKVLLFEDAFPSDNYYKISDCLNKIRVEGTFPEIQEIFDLKRSLETVKSILSFFRNMVSDKYPVLRSKCNTVKMYPYVLDAIGRIIDKHGAIKDNASPSLKDIRSKLSMKSIQVSKKLSIILKQAQNDGVVDKDTQTTIRNGRGVIPVNVYDKRKIRGLIHDQSASGKTVFVEPEEIVEINNDIVELEYEERREIVKILTAFADDIRPYIDDLLESNEFLGEIDFIRAKALLGNQFNSIQPVMSDTPGIFWKKAIHPLLYIAFKKTPDRKVVPLEITLSEKERILLISGPNAGGKSVCLKTVGLLQYMLQCGLTIPVAEGSESGIFNSILIDIGDEQSIDNDLSTYSSHLLNMKFFLKNGNNRTLVLIDEFGTGTEPMIGGSIAESIFDELNQKKVFGVITTHYTNLKHYASVTDGITNGAMDFDNHRMQPLFRLTMGKPGSSFAFEIARKIGLPENLLSDASKKVGVKNINYDKHLKDIARDKRYWETKRQNIRRDEKNLEELILKYETELSDIKGLRKEIIGKAKDEAQKILNESNRIIENTIKEIKESQAEKEKTRIARNELEQLKNDIISSEIQETVSEVRVEKMIEVVKKIKPELVQKRKVAGKRNDKPLKGGDSVRVTDTMAVGEVVSVKGGKAIVETGSIRLSLPVEKLEMISRKELNKTIRQSVRKSDNGTGYVGRNISFQPEIDLRGVRGEEAINRVMDLIDNAVIVQHRHLRILHGKGNGILRQLVREYLATVDVVKSFRDEHVDLGGSGITIVEMDL